jgi:hypothetical protein
MEYLLAHAGRQGRRYVYELIFDGDLASQAPRLPGLIDMEALFPGGQDEDQLTLPGFLEHSTMKPTSPGSMSDFAPRSPAVQPLFAPASPDPENALKASNGSPSSESTPSDAQNTRPGTEKPSASNPSPTPAPARSLCSLAAEVAKAKPLRATPARTARRA